MFRITIIVSLLCIATAAPDTADEDRIIGGRSVAISDFPYQCSLQNTGIHFCGGSIISPTRILTAAHCIKGVIQEKLSDLTVRCGSTMWSRGGQVKNIVGMKAHHQYNPITKKYDAGLIQLGSPLTFNSGVKAIKMADGVPADGNIGIISGWGVTDEKGYSIPNLLQTAEVTSVSRKSCSQPPWDFGDEILPSMICAQSDGKDGCQGDSGGPYVSKKTGKLWGIVSWGRGCARKGYPGVYCAIAAVRPWINANMDKF